MRKVAVCIDQHEVITGEMGKVAVYIDRDLVITKEKVEKFRFALINIML